MIAYLANKTQFRADILTSGCLRLPDWQGKRLVPCLPPPSRI